MKPTALILSSLLSSSIGLAQQTTAALDENFDACTSIMVSAGASTDGSVMITYSADAAFLPKLLFHKGGEHEAGELVDLMAWENDQVRGQVRQVAETYSVVGLMNDHQLALGETTTGGRRELRNRDGLLDYDGLMWLTLQRAKTAREAIRTIDALCEEYGYGSGGETIAIADKHEAWVLEIIGKGPGVMGAVWVAARVPEGYISASANMSRIGSFPLDDSKNWLYAEDLIPFAIEQGFYDPNSDEPFSYRDAYHPNPSTSSKRACATRVWSIFRRAAPGLELSPDFHRGVAGAEPYPLFVRAEKKLSTHDVMGLMRDHYEGTDYDMTQGIAAGPFGCPYRFRGLRFSVDDVNYSWERPIATQQAGFVMLAQCRKWLPDPIGGVYWYTPDDPYTSVFMPFYCGMTRLPEAFITGDHNEFDWDSAWWVSNLVSNLTYDRWSRILPDVQAVQGEQEDMFFTMMPAVESAAAELMKKDEDLARKFVTDWSMGSAESLFETWRSLAGAILTKHNDGYVREPGERSRGIGYSDEWLRRVIAERGAQLELPPAPVRTGG